MGRPVSRRTKPVRPLGRSYRPTTLPLVGQPHLRPNSLTSGFLVDTAKASRAKTLIVSSTGWGRSPARSLARYIDFASRLRYRAVDVLETIMRAYLLTAGLLAFVATGAAEAAPIVQAFQLTASAFKDIRSGQPINAPIDPVTGTFSITYDPDTRYIPATTDGLVVSGLNLSYSGVLQYTYKREADYSSLILSNHVGQNGFGILLGQNDLGLVINNYLGATNSYLVYSQSGFDTAFETTVISLTPVSVPEPASLAILTVGLVGILATRRRAGRDDSVAGFL